MEDQERVLRTVPVPEAVAEEVRQMLAAVGKGNDKLTGIVNRNISQALGANEPAPGDNIGAFRLLELLGRGGQGAVWLGQ